MAQLSKNEVSYNKCLTFGVKEPPVSQCELTIRLYLLLQVSNAMRLLLVFFILLNEGNQNVFH